MTGTVAQLSLLPVRGRGPLGHWAHSEGGRWGLWLAHMGRRKWPEGHSTCVTGGFIACLMLGRPVAVSQGKLRLHAPGERQPEECVSVPRGRMASATPNGHTSLLTPLLPIPESGGPCLSPPRPPP